jgi:hypothetical protein
MAIPIKIRNPKTIDDCQKNIEDLANSGMNKRGLDGLEQIEGELSASSWGANEASVVTKAINELNKLIEKIKNS